MTIDAEQTDPNQSDATSSAGARPRIVRSLVFVGGHDRQRISDVIGAGPDAVCVDLEDSTPIDAKEKARAAFADVAAELHAAGILAFARTNGPSGGMDEDLAAIACPQLHCASLPKVESAEQVVDFAERLERAAARAGLRGASILIRPIIETPQGVRHAYEIAAASPLVAYLGGVEGGVFGDLGGSLGYEQTDDGRETLYLRSKVLLDVRAAGVRCPIGGGSTARRDAESARRFARENRILGYDGVHCAADADVIAAVNDELTPDAGELAALRAVLPRLEAEEAAGRIVAHVDGRIYDLVGLPHIRERMELGTRLGII